MSFCEIPRKGAHAIVRRAREKYVHTRVCRYVCVCVCVWVYTRVDPLGLLGDGKTVRNAAPRDSVGGGARWFSLALLACRSSLLLNPP